MEITNPMWRHIALVSNSMDLWDRNRKINSNMIMIDELDILCFAKPDNCFANLTLLLLYLKYCLKEIC